MLVQPISFTKWLDCLSLIAHKAVFIPRTGMIPPPGRLLHIAQPAARSLLQRSSSSMEPLEAFLA